MEHLASCPGCAAALASARRVDALLRGRPTPPAPVQFITRVLNRVRRARWRSEQLLDLGFNIALALAAALVLVGLWVVMRQTGLATVGGDLFELIGPGMVLLARRISPSLPLYAAATALLGATLALWWWAEREV
jgi:hypothetical protein